MTVNDIKATLKCKVFAGEELLDREVHTACGSDMMSDVLAYVKDQSILLTGLVNAQVVRTADMMDMTKAVQLEIRGAQQTTNTEGDIEFRPMRVVVRGRGGKLTTGKVKAGSPMDTAITLTILYILIEVDGKTVVELDKLNEVYKVNGVDVLAKIKEMC